MRQDKNNRGSAGGLVAHRSACLSHKNGEQLEQLKTLQRKFEQSEQFSGLVHLLIELSKYDKNCIGKLERGFNGDDDNGYVVAAWALYDDEYKPTKEILHCLVEMPGCSEDIGLQFVYLAKQAGQLLIQLDVQLKTFNEYKLYESKALPEVFWLLALHEFGYAEKKDFTRINNLFGHKTLTAVIGDLALASALLCGHLIEQQKIEPQEIKGQSSDETNTSDYKTLNLATRTINIGSKSYQITSEKVWDFLKDLNSALKDDRLVPMFEGATNNKNNLDQLRNKIGTNNLKKFIISVRNGGYKLNPEVKILNGGQIGIRKTHLSRNSLKS